MKNSLRIAFWIFTGANLGWAADAGLAKGGASYLNFSMGARAIGMGHAQTAVLTNDASTLHANNALLSLQSAHTMSFTTGSLGLERNLYFAGYILPFHSRKEDDSWGSGSLLEESLSPSEQSAIERPSSEETWDTEFEDAPTRRRWRTPLVSVSRTDMAVGVGMTYLGIKGIEGRSEFGAREADFQNAERAIYFAYSARPYDNLSIGLGGKYLGQTLQSASAKGLGFDAGLWYGVPYVSRGHLSVAFTGRDLGGTLDWTVPDPALDTEFEYKEKVLSKWILGVAYLTPAERWLFAADLWKVSEQKVRLYGGLEWRMRPSFHLRAGVSAYNPTAGFGWILHREKIDLQLDYAYEYDLETLSSPHWLTLSLRFLPRRPS